MPKNLELNLNLTQADLEAMTIPALTELYNRLTPESQIKKFPTRAVALRRTLIALVDARFTETAKVKAAAKAEKADRAAVVAPEHIDTTPRVKKLASKAAVQKTDTVSTTMRRLLREGKTNAEIWEICKVKFNLPETKRGYPAWYRRELKLKGEL